MRRDLPEPPKDPPDAAAPTRRDLSVPVAPVGGRSSGRGTALAGVVLVAALAALIASGSLFPVQTTPGPTARPAASGRSTPPDGSPAAAATPPGGRASPAPAMPQLARMDASSLSASLRDGSLESTLLLIDAPLDVARVPCPTPAAGCVKLSVPGLDVPVRPVADIVPWDRDPAAGSTLVLVAGREALTFLGVIAADVRGPMTITHLLSDRNSILSLVDLYPVDGWLVLGPESRCAAGQAPTPAAPAANAPGLANPSGGRASCATLPFLADAAPGGTGTGDPGGGGSVALSASAVGLPDPGGAGAGGPDVARTGGTFLVRRMFRPPCDPAAPTGGFRCDQLFALRSQVVARIDPATAVRVTVP